jgi:hypothetical protein
MTEEERKLLAKDIVAELGARNCPCGLSHELKQYHNDDHRFIGEIRKGVRLGTKIGVGTFITVVTGSAIAAFWLGVRMMIINGGK